MKKASVLKSLVRVDSSGSTAGNEQYRFCTFLVLSFLLSNLKMMQIEDNYIMCLCEFLGM